MTELPLEGMPQRLVKVSPAKLGTWQDCPKRYRMAYVDRPAPPKGPAWAHNSFGSSVHTALKQWFSLARHERRPEAAQALVDRNWVGDGYRDAAQAGQHRDRAGAMVARYVADLDPDFDPLRVEWTVSVRHDPAALEGRIDRVDDRDGELVVVDYKTGRRPPGDDGARGVLALAVYAAAVARWLRRPCLKVELHHLPTGEVVSHEYTPETLERQLDRAADLTTELRDARDYPARPGALCEWCDFLRVCEEGRSAAQPKEPWAGLDAAFPEAV